MCYNFFLPGLYNNSGSAVRMVITSTIMEVTTSIQVSDQRNDRSMTRDEVFVQTPKTTLVSHADKPKSYSVNLLKAMGKTNVTSSPMVAKISS